MSASAGTLASSLFGLFGFVVLFALGVIALRWLQRRVGSNSMGGEDNDMRVVRRMPLDGQTMLVIVQIGEQQYALATSRQNGTQMIDRLESHIAERDAPFQGVFANVLRNRGSQA